MGDTHATEVKYKNKVLQATNFCLINQGKYAGTNPFKPARTLFRLVGI